MSPLSISSFPRAILHIDGDAFFASCEQARDPSLKGKPVVTGKERGIAASMSYEAKARGVTRGMRIFEILKVCPDAIILPSDYETYSIYSKRFFSIVRRRTAAVEEYSIDECFADITGLRRPLRMSYQEIAQAIQRDLATELGCTFSIGLGPTKVIAKIGSKWRKPAGFTAIAGKNIHLYLKELPIEKVWGIGPQTSAYLAKFGIRTALQFARMSEDWVKDRLSKPFYEIWQELRGRAVMDVCTDEKRTAVSIQKFKTFTPPTSDASFVFSQLSKNIENACIKARRHRLAPREVSFVLRTQDFRHFGMRITLSRPTAFPNKVIDIAEKIFSDIYQPGHAYRATGVTLGKLTEDVNAQLDLFGQHLAIEKMSRIYDGVDRLRERYGKYSVFLGSSFAAQKFAQHEGDRGDVPLRHGRVLAGETARRRLGIPFLFGDVS